MASRIRDNIALRGRLERARDTLKDEIRSNPFMQQEKIDILQTAIGYLNARTENLTKLIEEDQQAQEASAS